MNEWMDKTTEDRRLCMKSNCVHKRTFNVFSKAIQRLSAFSLRTSTSESDCLLANCKHYCKHSTANTVVNKWLLTTEASTFLFISSAIGVARILWLWVLMSRLPMLIQLELVLNVSYTPIFLFRTCLKFFNFQIWVLTSIMTPFWLRPIVLIHIIARQ